MLIKFINSLSNIIWWLLPTVKETNLLGEWQIQIGLQSRCYFLLLTTMTERAGFLFLFFLFSLFRKRVRISIDEKNNSSSGWTGVFFLSNRFSHKEETIRWSFEIVKEEWRAQLAHQLIRCQHQILGINILIIVSFCVSIETTKLICPKSIGWETIFCEICAKANRDGFLRINVQQEKRTSIRTTTTIITMLSLLSPHRDINDAITQLITIRKMNSLILIFVSSKTWQRFSNASATTIAISDNGQFLFSRSSDKCQPIQSNGRRLQPRAAQRWRTIGLRSEAKALPFSAIVRSARRSTFQRTRWIAYRIDALIIIWFWSITKMFRWCNRRADLRRPTPLHEWDRCGFGRIERESLPSEQYNDYPSSRAGAPPQSQPNYSMQGYNRPAAPPPAPQGGYYGPEGEQYLR